MSWREAKKWSLSCLCGKDNSNAHPAPREEPWLCADAAGDPGLFVCVHNSWTHELAHGQLMHKNPTQHLSLKTHNNIQRDLHMRNAPHAGLKLCLKGLFCFSFKSINYYTFCHRKFSNFDEGAREGKSVSPVRRGVVHFYLNTDDIASKPQQRVNQQSYLK